MYSRDQMKGSVVPEEELNWSASFAARTVVALTEQDVFVSQRAGVGDVSGGHGEVVVRRGRAHVPKHNHPLTLQIPHSLVSINSKSLQNYVCLCVCVFVCVCVCVVVVRLQLS